MNKYIKIALVISLIGAFASTISYCSAPFDTESAKNISIRKTVGGEGYILRNETIIEQPQNAVFEPSIKDGTRVSGGSTVGITISGNYSEDLVKRLENVSARIAEVKKSGDFADIYASDEARIFTALHDITKEIRTNAKSGNLLLAAQNTYQLQTLLEKKFPSKNSGAAQDLLSDLEAEKTMLEAQLGSIRENVSAPSSGYFYTSFDGLEQKLPESELFAISTADIYKIPQTLDEYEKPRTHVAKVIDTYAWYLVASIPKEEAELLTVGSGVTLSIDEGAPLKATVEAVNFDDIDSAAVVVKCTRNAAGIFEKREVSFEICYREHSGLYVPSAAIRIKDDITGVYVMNRDNTVSFRAVNIIWQEDNFVIASSNFKPPAGTSLKLYDSVLINPEVVRKRDFNE